ncbi:AMP-binding protein [Catenulispora yoronensis]
MHRTPRRVVGLLAILRAGAAYLGLDPDEPQERHSRLVAEAGVRFLISDLDSGLPEGLKVLTPETPVDETADPGAPSQTSDDPAYITYSTDEPSVVAVSHRSVNQLIARQGLTIDPDDVFLHGAPLASDAAALEVWAALTNGCRLAVLPPGPIDVDRLARVIAAEKVTVLALPEELLQELTDAYPAVLASVPKVVPAPLTTATAAL